MLKTILKLPKSVFIFSWCNNLGGPGLYNQQRGHPRLRIRHVVFPIDEVAKQYWLQSMKTALNNSEIGPGEIEFLWNYFQQTAEILKK